MQVGDLFKRHCASSNHFYHTDSFDYANNAVCFYSQSGDTHRARRCYTRGRRRKFKIAKLRERERIDTQISHVLHSCTGDGGVSNAYRAGYQQHGHWSCRCGRYKRVSAKVVSSGQLSRTRCNCLALIAFPLFAVGIRFVYRQESIYFTRQVLNILFICLLPYIYMWSTAAWLAYCYCPLG